LLGVGDACNTAAPGAFVLKQLQSSLNAKRKHLAAAGQLDLATTWKRAAATSSKEGKQGRGTEPASGSDTP
jgi:hypothetical protein